MYLKEYSEPTVGAIIFNPEKEILLVRSHKWKSNYVIPGGHIELGEKTRKKFNIDIFLHNLVLFNQE